MKTLCLLALAACATGKALGAEESSIALEAASPAQTCTFEGRQQAEPLPVLITLTPSNLADAAFLDPLMTCAPSQHLQVYARLEPPVEWLAAPDPYSAIGGWLIELEHFLELRHGAIRYFELGSRPDQKFDPSAYAFLVEKIGTLLRSLDPEAVLVLGSMGDRSGEWLESLDPRRLRPYVRGIALQDPVDLHDWLQRLGRDYAGIPVWLHADRLQADPTVLLRRFYESRAAGAGVFFCLVEQDSLLARVVQNLNRALPPRFVVDAGAAEENTVARLDFADPLGPERATVLLGAKDLRLVAEPGTVMNIRAYDLSTGDELATRITNDAQEPRETRIEVTGQAAITLVRYVIVREPRPAPEAVAVTGERELTAEEIIAAERAFEAIQVRVLDHYEATARISYHYRAETLGEAIDVSSINRFYWRAGAGEYQETDLYVNGARWHGKPPSLPFIQPERITEVPLEIRLDQSYTYRLEGIDTLQGEPVYVIAFEPARAETSLYSGEVWIHRHTFARMKLRLVQHGLKQPVTSNTDVIEYGPVSGRARMEERSEQAFWVPVHGYRQMVFTVLGREIAAERTVDYEGFSINSAEFSSHREAAYATGDKILREDETGYSYLEREGDGVRRRSVDSLVNVAFFGGLSLNSNGSLGTPFAGLNYFNFNWRNSGTQLDLAFAGPLADLVWTDPALGGSRWELTLDGRFVGVSGSFHGTNSAGAVEEEDLKTMQQRGLMILAHPITAFQKGAIQLEVDADRYSRDQSTDPNFVLPPDGLTAIGTARWDYIRNGYKLDLWFSQGHRLNWADWGFPDPNSQSGPIRLSRGSQADTDFQQWGLTALKSFYPGKLQNISLGVSLFDGSSLDRFSRFQIGDFRNARVRGFTSKDITFDRGATAQADYKFTLRGGGASVELGLEGAVIDNSDDFLRREYLIGGGAAISMSGPWSTLLSFRASFGLASSLDVSLGGASLRVVMIKTLDHWPRHRTQSR